MKEYYGKIQYKGKDYTLACNLNALEAIQEEYGTIDEWGSLTDGDTGEVNIKALIFGVREMINEGIDIENEENGTDIPHMTEKQVGRMISEVGIAETTEAMHGAVEQSTQSDEKNA